MSEKSHSIGSIGDAAQGMKGLGDMESPAINSKDEMCLKQTMHSKQVVKIVFRWLLCAYLTTSVSQGIRCAVQRLRNPKSWLTLGSTEPDMIGES